VFDPDCLSVCTLFIHARAPRCVSRSSGYRRYRRYKPAVVAPSRGGRRAVAAGPMPRLPGHDDEFDAFDQLPARRAKTSPRAHVNAESKVPLAQRAEGSDSDSGGDLERPKPLSRPVDTPRSVRSQSASGGERNAKKASSSGNDDELGVELPWLQRLRVCCSVLLGAEPSAIYTRSGASDASVVSTVSPLCRLSPTRIVSLAVSLAATLLVAVLLLRPSGRTAAPHRAWRSHPGGPPPPLPPP
jgi:hypothetical protein